jgi:hypothetical protein
MFPIPHFDMTSIKFLFLFFFSPLVLSFFSFLCLESFFDHHFTTKKEKRKRKETFQKKERKKKGKRKEDREIVCSKDEMRQ